jgi:hypothetical protein
MLTENDSALLAAAQTTIDKLRTELAECERDIEFQEMRASIYRDTIAMLTGRMTPTEVRQRQTRKRRGTQQETGASPVSDLDLRIQMEPTQ